MSSKNKKPIPCGPRHRRPVTREDLLPKKVIREMFQGRYINPEWMKREISRVFPDPKERQVYVNSLIKAMDGPPTEILGKV